MIYGNPNSPAVHIGIAALMCFGALPNSRAWRPISENVVSPAQWSAFRQLKRRIWLPPAAAEELPGVAEQDVKQAAAAAVDSRDDFGADRAVW